MELCMAMLLSDEPCVSHVPFSLLQAIKAKQDEPKKAQRATSNVFAMFRQAQVQEFKEVWVWIPNHQFSPKNLMQTCLYFP